MDKTWFEFELESESEKKKINLDKCNIQFNAKMTFFFLEKLKTENGIVGSCWLYMGYFGCTVYIIKIFLAQEFYFLSSMTLTESWSGKYLLSQHALQTMFSGYIYAQEENAASQKVHKNWNMKNASSLILICFKLGIVEMLLWKL